MPELTLADAHRLADAALPRPSKASGYSPTEYERNRCRFYLALDAVFPFIDAVDEREGGWLRPWLEAGAGDERDDAPTTFSAVFSHWEDAATGGPVEDERDLELTASNFHGGSTWEAVFMFDALDAADLAHLSERHGARPVFSLFPLETADAG